MNEQSAKKFETERTRRFRTQALGEHDERTINNIEAFGCTVVQVARGSYGLGWSYTIGVYDTCEKPEIIVVGLPETTAHFLANEAARQLRAGIQLTNGRHQGMIGNVECEFRPVDSKWVKHLMGWRIGTTTKHRFPYFRLSIPTSRIAFQRTKASIQYSSNLCCSPTFQ